MPLTLYVDGPRWRDHLRTTVADAHPGIVPVAKGNGYGFTVSNAGPPGRMAGRRPHRRRHLRRGCARSRSDSTATSWCSSRGGRSIPPQRRRARSTRSAALDDLRARAAHGPAARRARGADVDASARLRRRRPLRAAGRRLGMSASRGSRCICRWARPRRGVERWLERRPRTTAGSSAISTRPNSPSSADATPASSSGRGSAPHCGSATEARWPQRDRVDVHQVAARRPRRLPPTPDRQGRPSCSSCRAAPRTASPSRRRRRRVRARQRAVSVAKGGLEATGRSLSPFVVGGKQRWFVEPPHMQVSMVFVPADVDAAGDRRRGRRPGALHHDHVRPRASQLAVRRVGPSTSASCTSYRRARTARRRCPRRARRPAGRRRARRRAPGPATAHDVADHQRDQVQLAGDPDHDRERVHPVLARRARRRSRRCASRPRRSRRPRRPARSACRASAAEPAPRAAAARSRTAASRPC